MYICHEGIHGMLSKCNYRIIAGCTYARMGFMETSVKVTATRARCVLPFGVS